MSTLTLSAAPAALPVRLAGWHDEPGVVECALLENAENGFADAEPDLVAQRIHALVRKIGGLVGVIKGDEGIEAAIAIVFSRFWVTHEMHLEKLFAYVRPEFRRTDHAKSLFGFAKHAAERTGLKFIFAERSDFEMTDEMRALADRMEGSLNRLERRRYPHLKVVSADPRHRFYERQLKTAGSVFVYEPTPGGAA